MKKGISPLIASVVLIAFVVALAGIASTFFTDFIRERRAEIGDEGEDVVSCSVANFEIDPDTVSYNGSTGFINATIYIKGSSALRSFNMTVYSGTSTEQVSGAYSEGGYSPGRSVRLHGNTTLSPPLTKIVVTTEDCPGITDSVVNGSAGWS